MVVITRGLAEEIMIGENILIGVISIRGETVRLGIETTSATLLDKSKTDVKRLEIAVTVTESSEN